MIEILGSNLEQFFKNSGLTAKCTYKQATDLKEYYTLYEVWKVDDEAYKTMCNMSEEEFKSYYSNNELEKSDAWWRGRGFDDQWTSNMGLPNATYVIDGHKIRAWDGDECKIYEEQFCENCPDKLSGECDGTDSTDLCDKREYDTVIDYLSRELGASTPDNVYVVTHDLAKYNGLTLGELFNKCN